MADLIAIGYPDETTAEAAADEAWRLAKDLTIEPDAIAVIVRDQDGKYHVHTTQHAVGAGATWGMQKLQEALHGHQASVNRWPPVSPAARTV